MFKTRLLSGIVLVLLVIGVLYLGGYVTGVTVFLLSIGGILELLRIYKLHNTAIGYVTYVATAVYYAFLMFDLNQYIMPLMLGFILAVLSVYVITYPKFKDTDTMAAVLAFFYVAVMMS